MYQSKKRAYYAFIFTMLMVTQSVEIAAASWKEQIQSWWNKQYQKIKTPWWTTYALIGGLGIAALVAATYGLRTAKREPRRQGAATGEGDPIKLLTTLDPTMARVYDYLSKLGKDRYTELVGILEAYGKIPNTQITPLDLACTLVWYTDKEEFSKFANDQRQDNPYIKTLNKELNPKDYITGKDYEVHLRYGTGMTGFWEKGVTRDLVAEQVKFFQEFVQESFSAQWNSLKPASRLIKDRIENLRQRSNSDDLEALEEAFKESLLMQTKTIITERLKQIKSKNTYLPKYIDALMKKIGSL